jgi:hypothetical protein
VPIFNVANSPTGGSATTGVAGAINSLQGLLNTGNNTLSIDVIDKSKFSFKSKLSKSFLSSN